VLVQQQDVVPGRVDSNELVNLAIPLQEEREAFKDYITVRELAFISHISAQRIYHALTYARLRPMDGIKRGPMWFIRKGEALRWAASIAQWEIAHWESRLKRINRSQKRLDKGQPLMTPYKIVHRNYDRPPEGKRVYTFDQAADVLGCKRHSVSSMIAPTNVLAHVTRYTAEDRTPLLDADEIDAYMNRPITLRKDGTPDRRDRRVKFDNKAGAA
jgi:hypothetical protein